VTATDGITPTRLEKARRAAGLVVRHRRALWGIRRLRVSYMFFALYATIALGAVLGEPIVAGGAMAVAAVVEASDILPTDRRRRKLADWRRGLDVRAQWRTLLFVVALGSGSAPYPLIVAYGVLAMTIALTGRVMRSRALYLDSDRVLRPLGALTAGAERLVEGRGPSRGRESSASRRELSPGGEISPSCRCTWRSASPPCS
jgi:hypothetical protein